MPTKKAKGVFISFEGGEGAGKTTQIAKIAQKLKKHHRKVIVTREPGGSKRANLIRSLILNPKMTGLEPLTELFLYEASRAQHVADVIQPALDSGYLVICDRFTDSSVIYQGLGRGLSTRLVKKLNQIAVGNLKPKLTFILDLNPKIGLARVGARGVMDRIENERLEFHQRLRKGFRSLAKKESRRCFLIDASQNRDEIHHQICEILQKKKLLD